MEGFGDEVNVVVVVAWLTTCVSTLEVPLALPVSPLYWAVSERVPAGRVAVVSVAIPPLSVTVPKAFVPFRKATVPVGWLLVPLDTWAVRVTVCPYVEGFSEEPSATLVLATPTPDSATVWGLLLALL